MSDSNEKDFHCDEEIRQFAENLEGMRKRRRLLELQIQIAEEGKRLQEAQERLDTARQSGGRDNSGLASRQSPFACRSPVVPRSPALSRAPGQFTISAVDALIQSALNPISRNTTPTNSNKLEDNQMPADNTTPTNDYAPVNNERVQPEADLSAVHRPCIPESEIASHPLSEARMVTEKAKLEPSAPVRGSNEAAPRPDPSECPPYKGPYEKGENSEEKEKLLLESGQEPEKAADTTPCQPQTITQPASPWTPTQYTTACRIPATPPNPPDLEFGTYRGRRWAECVYFINNLEAHFARFSKYYTEARKVELGAKYISPTLMNAWHDHIMIPGNMSWMSYCTFLAQQLSRYANHRQAIEGITSAFQKSAQPVTHLALWLIQWAPVAPEVSSKELMAYLLRGVLPDIRFRAQKSYTEFSDYSSFAMYLQEVENSTPSRANFIAKRKNITVLNDELFVSRATDESERKPKCILPSEPPTRPTRRFEDLSPTESGSQSKRRLSPEVPAPQGLPLYSARSWRECKGFMSKLQVYFDKFGDHCKEARKIEIGRENLSHVLLEKWDEHAARLRTATWFAFCVFLVDQIPSEGAENFKYSNFYQRNSQSVCTFALELLRRAPDNFGAAHNRLRHLWDRVLPEIRSRARNTWKDFDNFHVFVAYLQQVQDSFSIRKLGLDSSQLPARKRLRIDESS